MNAEYALFEQKLRQAEKDKARLSQSLKRVKVQDKSKELYMYYNLNYKKSHF